MADAAPAKTGDLRRTPLYDAHTAEGARMVPFAGYEMPVQYSAGVLKEHLWTRANAGLFDVSHMGICYVRSDDGKHETVASALETMAPADIYGLKPGRQRYTQLLNKAGGIIDDLMVSRSADAAHDGWLFLVVNAARKAVDYRYMESQLPAGVSLIPTDDFALLALQGPMAEEVLAEHDQRVRDMPFMSAAFANVAGVDIHLTRSGYTGEDGFELPVPVDKVADVWSALIADDRVAPIGLGARDSLRLEAGLCLYGNDIDETTSPVEAGLAWSIQKVRRADGERAGGFPGADRILDELANGTSRKRVGLLGEGRAPIRAGTRLFDSPDSEDAVGTVTSGSFGPSVGRPVAMGYVATAHATAGTPLSAEVRGKRLPAEVTAMPFVPSNYRR